ncbi:hypothetical protein G647_04160 [Cladophialophora carrionii CBS 160.54]|uniref:Uncharacterized protein n=1 Tax=Cladophialophora carrionii CBS 160.54 TaxID=1279043 RepID=V9DD57_9EURO|nr:uncharacterized protein G647_04160 [Cladophialophora carrionii CBS 160.54]ETI24790.1 hypothetical protein G647_04160 [Cladophialophora carrionii CBS 160.54]
MPTILTPQGWVKVAPPPPRKKQPVSNPKAALRGPLAYLACQPQAPTLNVGGGNVSKGKAPFPYDLSASPEALKRQSQASRTVSAPVMHGALRPSGEDENENEIRNVRPEMETRLPPPPGSIPKSRSRSSRHHHDDDDRSVASSGSNLSSPSSSSSKSSASSRSSAPSVKSYTRRRPVEARPAGHPHPHPQPPAGPRDYFYPAPRYEHQFAPPPTPQVVHVPMPMGMSNGRSLSYSWYNATTPLNIK